MRTKETLQLRHQLSASGLSLRATAYDTKRHHVLSFDSHPLRPHALRLFSLRRELKSVPLFSDSPTPAAASSNASTATTQGQNRSSLFGLQQLQEKQHQVPKVEVVVPSMLLQYSATMDVFVCVYSRASRPKGATKVPRTTTHFVLLLEPASLRKLLLYSGPETHSLQCAMFDSITDRVVLASHLTSDLEDGEMLPKAPRNVVEILQLSKRPDERQTSWPAGSDSDKQLPRMLLFIENTRASLRHPETLTMICGSKGLKELYGAAHAMDTSSSALLEWRQNQPTGGKFVLVRRVMLREKITALTVSPCRDWLLAGFAKGGLRVWNVNGSRTNGSALFTIDTEPFEPTGPVVSEAQAEVISSIEITTTPAPGATGDTATATGATDVSVIAAERDTGAVRHWMLSVGRKVFESSSEAADAAEHRYPKLTLVGYFNAGGKDQVGKEGSPAQFKNQDTLGPPLKTLVMCVTIDMGSCFENLLLVVREDVIHVLKVQTVLYVMQEFASIEEAYAVRAIMQQDDCKVLSLSSTAACKLRIFALDETANHPSSSSAKLLFIQPSVASAHVSSMETVTDDNTQLSFVVLAWSSGVVDVYDVLRGRHVMTLQDKQLTDQISALAVVTFQRIAKSTSTTVDEESDEAPYCTPRSFRVQNHASSLTTCTSTDRAQEAARKTLIIVGTESGKLYGWKADAIWDENLGFHSIRKSDVRVKAAHSSHVIQLARVSSDANGELALLASAGADGIIKLWKVPSLKMIGYVSSSAEGLPVTPSCIELMKSKAGVVDSGRQTASQLYVAAGYEDGHLAVWGVDSKRVSFQRLEVSTKHERRVSKICRVSSELVPTGSMEFMSCSLDMTVIQWQVAGTGGVQEKRYFDVGTAVVDMVLIREQVVVALAHEICKFAFALSVKCDMKYLMKPGATVETSIEAMKLQNEEQRACSRIDPEEYPDTPTTRSVEDPTESAIPSHQTSRSVDEYLTLHVPSAVLHLEAASSSVVAAEADSGSAPVTRTSEQEEECPPNSARNEIDHGYLRMSKSTDKLQRPLIDEDTLRRYLDEYIAQHGTGGKMAANRITHLLALRPELPSVRRPGFALAKSLKDMKLSAQDRVSSEEALQVLRLLFAMSRASCQSFDAPTMTRSLKTKEHMSERARAQRLREKKQARRKPVVTYNLLGEKYVQWEDVPEEFQVLRPNQSPASPTNSLVVHTPPSPNVRDADVVGFEEDSPHNDIGFLDAQLSSSAADTDGVLSTPSRVEEKDSSTSQLPADNTALSNVSPNEVLKEPENITLTADQPDLSEDSEEGEEEEDEDENVDSDDDNGENDATEVQELHQVVVSSQVEASQASQLPKKAHHRKRLKNYAEPISNISKNALVSSIRLSPMFQPLWTKGYCWCGPSPTLHIIWTDKNRSKSKQESKTTTIKRKPKCKTCRKRLHTVELPRVGYTPHFSRQATFDIIVDVYSKLTSTAHAQLYKNSTPRKERSSDCSIFGALFEVFLATYGMREAVETKLKLFFVSMCHFLPEYDAVAVFGELLGLHTPAHVDENDQAPSTLVALCVCCYSWLYSRAMVVNGDTFSGQLRGREWGNIYKPVTSEVVPGTDGTTHWQFVRLEHALLCAQDNLLYPLVSPGFLKNIMLFMQEYAQRTSTRSLRTDSPDFTHDGMGGSARWIELHRFLRLLVGEWKQQNAEFRVVERLLFVHPQRDTIVDSDLLEKLRLMLSCFVFYDHERVGAMSTSDFESLLFKLRYLWSDDSVALASKGVVFENAIAAAKKRFLDLNHDGQLCYLDFWAMLYIVGVKTRGLIHFHEIPSFCRDYRLEVSPELSDMVWNYMQLSCTLLLPKGLQVGKSSIDQKAERQHRRRVSGLHDGTFHITKTMKSSLSTQELLAGDKNKGRGLFLDGTIPATRQTASTTALERFRPVSVDNEFGREPMVVGVRSTGPTPKPVAPLRVSLMGNVDLSPDSGSMAKVEKNPGRQPIGTTCASGGGSAAPYTSMYIQFPQIPPVRRRIGPNETSFSTRQIAFMADDTGSEDDVAVFDDSELQQDEELVQMEELPTLSRTLSQRSMASVKEEIQPDQVAADQPDQIARKPSLERRRSTTAVVVVPTIETAASISRGSSKSELLKRQPSGLQRAVSERIRLEEIAAQLDAEKIVVPARQPTPATSSVVAREEFPPDTESDESPSVASSDEGSEAGGNGDREADEQEADSPFERETPDVSAPILVEEDPPAPEVVQAPDEVNAEPVIPLVLEPRVEEVDASVLSELASSPEPQELPGVEAVVLPETETVVEEVVSPVEPAIEEPPPPVESAPDLEEDTENVIEEEVQTTIADHPYKPQAIKVDDIQIHHAFRFSQQPTFIRSVAVTNNPYRTTMWNPNDDSGSDDDDGEKIKNGKAEGFDLDESVYSSGDEYAGDSVNKAKRPKEGVHTSEASQESESSAATMPKTELKRQSSANLTRSDSNLQPTQRNKKDRQTVPLEYRFSKDLEAIQDEGDDELGSTTLSIQPVKRKRLDEDAERALYGERVVNVLGEGIAFSPEAEAAMQQKWQQFFDDSESKMFAAMRHDLEKKQTEQREAEERQRKLRKKWQEQRDQDLQRLQNSRHNSIVLSTTNSNSATGGVEASFRLRRIHRESCRQFTQELQFGVSEQREFKEAKETQFFHFYYLPEGHGSIITLKLHVLRGDAEVFMSTDTKVPCSTDFMWRSADRTTKDSGEGQRIILYPHDLLRVVTAATANAAPTEHAAAIVEANASTASLRSFYPKQPDTVSLRIGFYLSVVALEPGTTFTLAVMSSGQKMQPSRAIQTVDYLIDRFNMLSRSFQGQPIVPFPSKTGTKTPQTALRNEIIRQSSAGSIDDTMDEAEGEDNDGNADNESIQTSGGRRKTKKVDAVDVDPEELKSFQHLLETLSEKKGAGSPRGASILLSGPCDEHLEFVQDEDQRLQEIHRQLSPPKSCPDGYRDSISVVTERRLTLQGKRQKLRKVIAARLQQKLEPLRHKSIAGGALEKSASTGALANIRVAKTAPRPVAYSLTTLDPIPRSQRFKAATAPLLQARQKGTVVAEKASADGAESAKRV